MGRYFFTILLCVFYISKVSAQRKEIDKLIFLYIDEKFEKCVSKGLNMIESDDFKREPLPYLYVSMSYYELAKKDEVAEKYPRAFKYAMKYAYKYRKKDKNLEYAGKYRDYFVTLKDSANNLGQLYFKTEDYRKAAYVYKQIMKFDPDAHIMHLWQGLAEIKSRNIGEGERNAGLAMEQITDTYAPDETELEVATLGFTEYANYMDGKGDYAATRKGKKLADKFREYDPVEIKKREDEKAEKDKPVREVKKFKTTDEDEKNQKVQIIGSDETSVEDAKEEIEKIKEEQTKGNERQVKSFSSDEEDE